MCQVLVEQNDTKESHSMSKKPFTFQGLSLLLPIPQDGKLKIINISINAPLN